MAKKKDNPSKLENTEVTNLLDSSDKDIRFLEDGTYNWIHDITSVVKDNDIKEFAEDNVIYKVEKLDVLGISDNIKKVIPIDVRKISLRSLRRLYDSLKENKDEIKDERVKEILKRPESKFDKKVFQDIQKYTNDYYVLKNSLDQLIEELRENKDNINDEDIKRLVEGTKNINEIQKETNTKLSGINFSFIVPKNYITNKLEDNPDIIQKYNNSYYTSIQRENKPIENTPITKSEENVKEKPPIENLPTKNEKTSNIENTSTTSSTQDNEPTITDEESEESKVFKFKQQQENSIENTSTTSSTQDNEPNIVQTQKQEVSIEKTPIENISTIKNIPEIKNNSKSKSLDISKKKENENKIEKSENSTNKEEIVPITSTSNQVENKNTNINNNQNNIGNSIDLTQTNQLLSILIQKIDRLSKELSTRSNKILEH